MLELVLIPTLTFILGMIVGAGITAYYVKKKLDKLKQNPMQAMGDAMDDMMEELEDPQKDDI